LKQKKGKRDMNIQTKTKILKMKKTRKRKMKRMRKRKAKKTRKKVKIDCHED